MILALLLSFAWANEWVDHCANLIAPGTDFSVAEVSAGLEEIAEIKIKLFEKFAPADHTFVLVGRSNTILDGLLNNESGVDVRRLPLSLRYYVNGEFDRRLLTRVFEHYLGPGKRWVFLDFASSGSTFAALNDIVERALGIANARFGVISKEWPKLIAAQPGQSWLHLKISENLRALLLNDVFKPFAPQDSFDLYKLRYLQNKTGAFPAPELNSRFLDLSF